MHAATIAAKLITNPAGAPTGLTVSIEIAAGEADAEGIRAAFAEGFRLLRQAIEDQIGPIDVPSAAPAEPPAPQPPAPAYTPPATPEEAQQRFFARYREIVGGQDWSAVRRYLNSRAPRPATVEGWIAAAEAVRDASRPQAQPAERPRNGRAPTRR